MVDLVACALEKMDSEYFNKFEIYNKETIRAKVRAMVRAYDVVWGEQNQKLQILGAEKMMLAPLKNLKTGKDSGYQQAGKLDILAQELTDRKQTIIMDHKFLSSSFDDNDMLHLEVAGQQLTYAYLGYANSIKFDAAVWDIIVKSQHVRRKDSRKVTKGKPERIAGRSTEQYGITYKKGEMIPSTPDVIVDVAGESAEEFEERIFQIYIENPERFFARPKVQVDLSMVADHMHEVYLWTKELDLDITAEYHLRNPEACMKWGSPCEFLGLCTNRSHINDGTWEIKSMVHEELELPAGSDQFKIITNSRMQCFRSCRLQHDRKYNIGLVKKGKQLSEPLFVGSAGHVGLQYYYEALALQQGTVL